MKYVRQKAWKLVEKAGGLALTIACLIGSS